MYLKEEGLNLHYLQPFELQVCQQHRKIIKAKIIVNAIIA